MNPSSRKEAKALFERIEEETMSLEKTRVVVCPPFPYLSFQPSSFLLGAQDCFWKKEGAYTGEVSPLMLKDLGCEYVILGHSEREKYLGETEKMVRKKAEAALSSGLKPVLCLGEKRRGELEEALEPRLQVLGESLLSDPRVVLAYEPVWAISTEGGEEASPEEMKRGKRVLTEARKEGPILYGGSVDSGNIKKYGRVGFDGFLVGGASLRPEEFGLLAAALES